MLVTLRQIVQEVSAATHMDDVLDIIVHRVKDVLQGVPAYYYTCVEWPFAVPTINDNNGISP